MSDESLQLAVNSIHYFLSCHHYLHSLSAPTPAPSWQLQESLLVRIWETLLWTKCENKCLVVIRVVGFRGLMLPTSWLWMWGAISWSVILIVLTPDKKIETQARRWNTSDALICSLMLAGFCAGPQRDACPLTRCSECRRAADWISTWLYWIHSKCIQNNAAAVPLFNALK